MSWRKTPNLDGRGLTVTRKMGESVTIVIPGGPSIEVQYSARNASSIKMRIVAPSHFDIYRTEQLDEKAKECLNP